MRLNRRRRTTEVAQWALADIDLKPFIYVYELPPEYNVAFNALPAGWHSEQYDCALPHDAEAPCRHTHSVGSSLPHVPYSMARPCVPGMSVPCCLSAVKAAGMSQHWVGGVHS